MNKKILATAIATAAASVSVGAFADVTITADATNTPRVAPGGTVVFENQVLTQSVAPGTDAHLDLTPGDIVVMSLPAGMNFVGTATPTATSTGSLNLESNSNGDPGSSGLVTLTDTNADGGNDRMSVKVKTAAAINDTIIIKGAAVYSGTATTGALNPTIFVEETVSGTKGIQVGNGGGVDTDNILATRVAAVATPVQQLTSNANLTIANTTNAGKVTTPTTGSMVVTIPSGKTTGQTVVLTLGAGLKLDSTSSITVTSLTDDAPDLSPAAAADAGGAITLSLTAATTRDSQYLVVVDGYEVTAQTTPGPVSATISGTAGLSGSVTMAVLANAGSTTALATTTPATTAATTSIVAGAAESITLPSFTITENFNSNLGTDNFTIVAGSGMTFDDTAPSDQASGTGWTITGPTFNTAKTKATFDITTNPGTKAVITVSGLKATASSSASGVLNVTVGDSGATGESSNIPNTVLGIATAIPRGAVSIAGPSTTPQIGKGSGKTGVITLTEATYGAISAANKTSTQSAFIQVTPPAGVTITALAEAPNTASNGSGNVDIAATGSSTVPSDGSFVIILNKESTVKSVSDLTVTYTVADSVAIGTDVVFTLGGNAAVSGTATVATVANATTNTAGTIPSVTPGSANEQDLATLTIKENFAGSLNLSATTREIRLIAPAGVTFANAGHTTTGIGTVTRSTTFNANDTLRLTSITDATGVVTLSIKPKAIVGNTVAADSLLAFTIADGDGVASTTADATGVTTGSVNLAFSGTLTALDAGASAAVNVGFTTSNTITGGVGPFTASSSNTAAATVSVDGSVVTVTGVAAGNATITVTDSLNSTDTFATTVSAGATQTPSTGLQKADGSSTTATISSGATKDGGTTFETAFTTGDDVDIVGTIVPETADVGKAGDLFIVVRTIDADGVSSWTMKGVDGNFQTWNTKLADVVPAVELSSLAASNKVTVFEGTLAAGSHRVFLGYMAADGQLIFNNVPLSIDVTAP
ncbi:MAG: Ig-like domain-containing protein [Pseudomonadales bacterium]|nr:Ig-like domain-containing protein [Pseudomonadales bacterium]